MLDMHCHILPGVDDGAQTLDESLRMARFCVEDGITTIVATPHCHRFIHLLRAEIVPRVEQLNRDFKIAAIPLTILPGSEIQVTDSAEYRREFEAGLYCHLGDRSDFTLLEFNWVREQFPADAVELIQWLCARGTTPILAHPERYQYFGAEPDLLTAMVNVGAWVQITVDSLLGNHGPHPEAFGKRYLEQFPNAVLATDAHNMHRCSGMAAGYEWVTEHLGKGISDDLRGRAESIQKHLCATG
jgi:protein-tyrosine phosphatase